MTANSASSGSAAAISNGRGGATPAISSPTGTSAASMPHTRPMTLSCRPGATPEASRSRIIEEPPSKTNCSAKAPAYTGQCSNEGSPGAAIVNSAAGPTANQASPKCSTMRSGCTRRRRYSGSRDRSRASATSSGASAGETSRSIGTSTSWLGEVIPAPTLKRTRCAIAKATSSSAAWASSAGSGFGPISASAATAATSATAIAASVARSRPARGISARGTASRSSASTSGSVSMGSRPMSLLSACTAPHLRRSDTCPLGLVSRAGHDDRIRAVSEDGENPVMEDSK